MIQETSRDRPDGQDFKVTAPDPTDPRFEIETELQLRLRDFPVPARTDFFLRTLLENLGTLAQCLEANEESMKRCRMVLRLWVLDWDARSSVSGGASSRAADEFFSGHPEHAKLGREVVALLRTLADPVDLAGLPEELHPSFDLLHDVLMSLDASPAFEESMLRRSLTLGCAMGAVGKRSWLDREVDRMSASRFRTFAAELRFGKQLAENTHLVREIRARLPEQPPSKEARKSTFLLYRVVSRNMVEMLGIADKKAGLLMSANAISLSLLVSFLGRLQNHPQLWGAAITITATCALTVVFACLAAKPVNRDPTRLSLRQFFSRKMAILHYGHIARLSADDFVTGYREVVDDPRALERSILSELHFFSGRIVHKFRLVQWAYLTLILGILTSGLVFVISL